MSKSTQIGVMRAVRRFTPEEDERLVELRLQFTGLKRGVPRAEKVGGLRDIAKIMGRAHSSIQIRLQTLAEREDRDERREVARRWRHRVCDVRP